METEIKKIINECEKKCLERFRIFEETALFNQEKVLNAFRKNRIALRHFSGTTGYAYGDEGREALSRVFADIFCGQRAIVSPLFASGTHTISTALFGILRPNDTVLCITGEPYSTLKKVINGKNQKNIGSLTDFLIDFKTVDLTFNNEFNKEEIIKQIKNNNPKIIYIQRAKGYSWRKAISIDSIKEIALLLKNFTNAPIVVDNCYGEFVNIQEPLEVGANLVMGSLIKNAGGGLAPTGGYIVGDANLIESIEGRYSAPGVGFEIGAYPFGYQYFFQGIFTAPHTVLQSQKSALLFSEALNKLGYEVLAYGEMPLDITCCVKFKTSDELVKFCRAVQRCSPVDSFVVPYPSKMPGYVNEIIMAAGTFVQGSSIELSADAPIVEPYICYIQGSLTYEHAKIALCEIIEVLRD